MKYKQGELFGNLGYFLTLSGLYDKNGGLGTAAKLKPAATSVYLCLRSVCDWTTGIASISTGELSARVGATKPTIDKALVVLEEQKLIKRLNPNAGKVRRIFQLYERLPFYEQQELNGEQRGWLVAKHHPRETTKRLSEAKEFFQTREAPPSSGFRVEKLEVNVENLQVNLSVVHNHYGSTSNSNGGDLDIAAELVRQLTAAMKQGGPVAEMAKRLLLKNEEDEG